MKTGLSCLVFLVTLLTCANGGEPEILWSTSFPGSSGSVVWDAAEASSGGYVAVGEVCFGTAGEKALSLSRIDSEGIVLWESTALNLGNASAYSIEEMLDGFAVCGICSDSSDAKGLIMKVDDSGNSLWALHAGYGNDNALLDLCITPEGNILAVGYSYNQETSDNDILAVCVSDSGSIIWQKRFVAPGYQTAYSITPSIDSDQEFILTGSDDGNLFLMKIDNQGNWIWKSSHYLEGNQNGRSVTASSDNRYIVAGSTRTGGGFSDVLLVMFDADGKVISDFVWGTDGPDNAYSIREVTPAGFVVLVNSNSGTGAGYRPSILRFDPWYSIIWSMEIADRDALLYSLEQTVEGGFIATGKISSTDEESDTEYSSCVVRLSPEDLLNWD